ncbi:hypothetical protein [Entomospira culicis]|uniref:Uncharacterized protein n=1 Tax=Entomospira culicis TaxID=2719989 RepID=A0A968GH47_9SPIO|nr:hypothetical protein [Entomospira culicis]NIZ19774.1 hypothetical protein [Entomospira culicis]NIZ69988.1 hypothetical protein [Entomospira culicis]WDI37093.1 hypothetical protein PVA46_07170 [Entomospira culicis]WDI38722.1 hypothetical protein PVA47_07180 [Entomospira culicis]
MKNMLAVGAIVMISLGMASIPGISANKEQANSNSGAQMTDFKVPKEGFIDDADKAIRLALVYIHYYGNYEITYDQLTATLNGDVWSISRKGEVVMQLLKSSGAVEHLNFTRIGHEEGGDWYRLKIKENGYVYDGLLAMKIANVIYDERYMQKGGNNEPTFPSYDYAFTLESISTEAEEIRIWLIDTKYPIYIDNDSVELMLGGQLAFKIRQKDGALLGIIDIG